MDAHQVVLIQDHERLNGYIAVELGSGRTVARGYLCIDVNMALPDGPRTLVSGVRFEGEPETG